MGNRSVKIGQIDLYFVGQIIISLHNSIQMSCSYPFLIVIDFMVSHLYKARTFRQVRRLLPSLFAQFLVHLPLNVCLIIATFCTYLRGTRNHTTKCAYTFRTVLLKSINILSVWHDNLVILTR